MTDLREACRRRIDAINEDAEADAEVKVNNNKHLEPLVRRYDDSIYGYRCVCGGWWKIYQQPYHEAGCEYA